MLQRLGRASIRHPRRALAVWFLAVVGSVAAAPVLFSSLTTDMAEGGGSESARADDRMGELFDQLPPGTVEPEGEVLLAVVDGLAVDDPATESAVTAATDAISDLAGVASVLDPYRAPDAGL